MYAKLNIYHSQTAYNLDTTQTEIAENKMNGIRYLHFVDYDLNIMATKLTI